MTDYESNFKSKVPASGIIGWVEKDGVDGMSRPDEEVHIGDIIVPNVVVLVKCNNCTCTPSLGINCSSLLCPTNCAWNTWSTWGSCTRPCGGGLQSRNRTFNPAENGGQRCYGSSTDSRLCNEIDCPVDCEWTTWGSWSNCTHPCGGGSRSRSRRKGQEAEYGGDKCVGESNEDQPCNTFSCTHTNCTEDKLWVDCVERPACPNTCFDLGHPNGCVEPDVCVPRCACPPSMVEDKNGHCVHTNTCICVDDDGNEYLNGFVDKSSKCQICSCWDAVYNCTDTPCDEDCEWGTWSRWSDCTQPCSGGSATRTRSINKPKKRDGEDCEGDKIETKACNTDECPMCRDDNNNVYEPYQTVNETDCDICICNEDSVIECNAKVNANIDGSWSSWGKWSDCSATCAMGTKYRSRTCSNPKPNCAGSICTGNYTDQAPCGPGFTCPVYTTPQTTTRLVPLCVDLEEFVVYRCERTCENMTAETNVCLYGNEVFNDCACENGFYRHRNGSCVPGDVCKLCIIDGKVMPAVWEAPGEPCIKYSCVDGAVESVDESASCKCAPGYVMKAPALGKCCNCIPEGGPQVKCQLTTLKKTINMTDERGIGCATPADVFLTTCSGSCDSWDMSPVRFKDTGVEVAHTHECACCSGVGSYVDVEVLCGDVKRTVQVMQFTGCSCKACVETGPGAAAMTVSPVVTTPVPAACVTNTLDYDTKDQVMFVVMGSREVTANKAPVYALANSGSMYRSHNTVNNPYLYINLPMNSRFIVRQVTMITKKASDVKISLYESASSTGPVVRLVSDLDTSKEEKISEVFGDYATTIRFDFTGTNVRVHSLQIVVVQCTGGATPKIPPV